MQGNRSSLIPIFVGGIASGVNAASQVAATEANRQNQALQARQMAIQEQQLARQNQLAPQIMSLRTRALTDPRALNELAALSPESAQEILQFQQGQQKLAQDRFSALNDRERSRVESVSIGAMEISGIPSVEGKIAALERRQLANARAGLDSNETNEVLELYRQGRVDEADALVNGAVNVGRSLGILKAGAAPSIREGVTDAGQPAFFAVTPQGAQVIPGAQPAKKSPLVQISEGVGKADVDKIKRADEQAEIASDGLAEIADFRAALGIVKSNDAFLGPGVSQTMPLRRLSAELGISDDETLSAVSAINSLGTKFTLELTKILKGAISDREIALLKSASPGSNKSVVENENLADILEAGYFRRNNKAEFLRSYLERNGNLNGAETQWRKFVNQTPIVGADGKFIRENATKWDSYLQRGASPLPDGVTEEDVRFTMKKHGVSRDEVIRRLNGG